MFESYLYINIKTYKNKTISAYLIIPMERRKNENDYPAFA